MFEIRGSSAYNSFMITIEQTLNILKQDQNSEKF